MTQLASSEWNLLTPEGICVEFHEVCESTNILANAYGASGPASPKWFVAAEQKTGRGRRGRNWSSPLGNLYCSYIFQPIVKPSELGTLPFLVSLAVRDTFIGLGCASAKVACKWPNDVLIAEKKASGILIETSTASGQAAGFVVVGIGLNLTHFPSDALFPATSVAAECGNPPEVTSAFKILSHSLDSRLGSWVENGPSQTIKEWRANTWGLGMRREIRTNDETFHATLIGLNDDGGLSLRLDNGIEKRVYTGDVFTSPTNNDKTN